MSAADLGPAWSAWTQVTPVVTSRATGARYMRVAIPPAIAADESGAFPDLRVVDDRGAEHPYALDPVRPAPDDQDVPLIDVGFVPHHGTQGVVDLGTAGNVIDAVTLDVDVTTRPTYFQYVAIDASDDRHTWRIVRNDAVIYRVAQDAGRGSTTLSFPPTRSRWLRVRVLDPNAAFPIAGARVSASEPVQPSPVRVGGAPAESGDEATNTQTWTFSPAVPVRAAAVTFADGGARYERAVTVEASNDRESWIPVGEGTISHYAEGGAQSTVCLTEMRARFVRVTVRNGDDAPLQTLRPTLLATPHTIVFAAGGTRRLLSGNPQAHAPTYDLAARLAHEDWRADDATTGPPSGAVGSSKPFPFGDRSALLTGALLAVALLLGVIALRSIPPTEA
jgi:hypothetical protein